LVPNRDPSQRSGGRERFHRTTARPDVARDARRYFHRACHRAGHRRHQPRNHRTHRVVTMFRESARRQFRVLYRLFLARIIDLEILSAGGDVRDLVARFVSVLAAFSLVLTYLIAGRYFTTTL